MRTALITGGGRGLGKGFVDYLLTNDYLVFAGVRNPKKSDLPTHKNLRVISLDVASDESISHAVDTIAAEINHLDVLVNNAGINKDSATNNHKELVCELPKLKRELILSMFNINAVSPMMTVQRCLPLLKEAEKSFIINISSDRASYHDENKNSTGNYGYRASKIALNMMTFCSVFDLPTTVQTFAVHPGSVKTHMNPAGNSEPYEQAEKIIAITKNWNPDFNGKFLRFDGTLYPL